MTMSLSPLYSLWNLLNPPIPLALGKCSRLILSPSNCFSSSFATIDAHTEVPPPTFCGITKVKFANANDDTNINNNKSFFMRTPV